MKKILFFLFLIFTIQEGYSCSCAPRASVEYNWENANEVFTGKIIKIDSSLYGTNGSKIYSYTVRILESFKEDFHKNRELRTFLSQDEASCDFMFQVGKEYLIYAKRESHSLVTSICSRTNLVKNVESAEIEALKKLYQIYAADTSGVRTMKMENNASYQVGLVKNAFEEKIKYQNSIIYLFSGTIALLVVGFLVILKKRR